MMSWMMLTQLAVASTPPSAAAAPGPSLEVEKMALYVAEHAVRREGTQVYWEETHPFITIKAGGLSIRLNPVHDGQLSVTGTYPIVSQIVRYDERAASMKWQRDDGLWLADSGTVELTVDGGQLTAALDIVFRTAGEPQSLQDTIEGPWRLQCHHRGGEVREDGHRALVVDSALETTFCAMFTGFIPESGPEQAIALPPLNL